MKLNQIRKRSLTKSLLVIFALVLICVVVYSIYLILVARRETPAIIEEAMNSEQIALMIEAFSEEQIEILLKVEDPNFYHHKGVDLLTPGAGMTTITQGLVKKFYFRKFKPGIAKFKQTLIARFALNSLVSKRDQLQLFINYVYFGQADGQVVIGFEHASQVYFYRSFAQITEDEYLSLVAMIISPNILNLKTNPEGVANRVKRIKLLLAGEYTPKGLMDLYYGE